MPRTDRRTAAQPIDVSGQILHAETRADWVAHAKCREMDPDELFVTGAEQRRVASVCEGCPVLLRCRAEALDHQMEFGVWGGLTERQRRAVLRRNPHITDWFTYLVDGGEMIGI